MRYGGLRGEVHVDGGAMGAGMKFDIFNMEVSSFLSLLKVFLGGEGLWQEGAAEAEDPLHRHQEQQQQQQQQHRPPSPKAPLQTTSIPFVFFVHLSSSPPPPSPAAPPKDQEVLQEDLRIRLMP